MTGRNRNVPQQQIMVSPEFAISRMMPHSAMYTDHQALADPYTTGYSTTPQYATHQGMDAFHHDPSHTEAYYHGLHEQATSRFPVHDDMNGYNYHDMRR